MKWLTQWAITSSVLVLIVLAVRYLFRDKLSARLRYALWAVVLVRLLVPFQVELPANTSVPLLASNLANPLEERLDAENERLSMSYIALIPSELVTWENIPKGEDTYLQISLPYDHAPLPDNIPVNEEDVIYRTVAAGDHRMDDMLLALWRTGVGVTGGVILLSNLHFSKELRKQRKRLEDMESPIPVYTAANAPSPCLFGVFRPAVYVTPGAEKDPDTLRHILAHELTHYAHKVHIWSLLRCLALAFHWYNPLVWLAVVLSKRDAELACDEGAVARLGETERIPYGRTLVDMVARRSLRPTDLLSCSTAMTGGKKSIQQRVAWLVKKPETVKTALFAVVAVVAVAVVFVFAGRKEADLPEYGVFLAQVEAAQSIFVGNPVISSQSPPPAISDPAALAQAKDILSKVTLVVKEENQWTVMSLSSDSAKHPEPIAQEELEQMFFLRGCSLNLFPTADQDLDTADHYSLISWDDYCLLTRWYPEREENTVEVVAALPGNTINRLMALARQEAVPAEPDTPAGQEESDQQHTPAEPVRYQIDDADRCAQLSQLFLGDEECKAMNDTSDHEMEDWLTNWTSFYKVYYGPPYLTSVGTEPGWYAHAVDAGSFYFIQIPDHLVPQVLAVCRSSGTGPS